MVKKTPKMPSETVFTWHDTCHVLSIRKSLTRITRASFETGMVSEPAEGTWLRSNAMTILDLIKATVTCGLIAFLIYSFPLLGQVLLIGLLSLLWLAYAHKTVVYLRRKRAPGARRRSSPPERVPS